MHAEEDDVANPTLLQQVPDLHARVADGVLVVDLDGGDLAEVTLTLAAPRRVARPAAGVTLASFETDSPYATPPRDDKEFLDYVTHPGLAGLLNVLYPDAFPNLADRMALPARREPSGEGGRRRRRASTQTS